MKRIYTFTIGIMLFVTFSVFSEVRKVRVTCSSCNGTGKDKYSTIDAPDYSGKGTKVYCSICGKSVKRHTHKSCSACLGRGWVEKSEYYQNDEKRGSGWQSSTENSSTNTFSSLKFEWYYNYEPEPGRRLWYQLDGYSWVEQYPSGYKNYFTYLRNYTLDGVSGILVQKQVDDSLVFIPSRNSANMWLRMKLSNENSWRNIAQIKYLN